MMDVAKARREMALDQLRTRFGVPQPPVGALNPRNPSDMDVIGWALAELLECVGDEAPWAAAYEQEKAWRLAETESATISALSEAAMGERLRTAERERDEAVARAEKAEREIARLWPVVDNLAEQAIAVADCHGSTTCPCRKRLRALVDDYRAARKEAA